MNIADYIKNELPKWPNWINNIILKMNVFGSKVYGKKYEVAKKEIESLIPEEKLCEIVNFAIERVPYYRKKYGTLRINSIKENNKWRIDDFIHLDGTYSVAETARKSIQQ